MQTFVNMVHKVALETSNYGKKEALRGLSEDGQKLLKYALDPMITFGVKKIPHIRINKEVDGDTKYFFELLENLYQRRATGNAAFHEMCMILSLYTPATQRKLKMVLEKHLGIGIGPSLVNQVYPGLITKFKCMLAKPMDDTFDWNSGPWLVEAKYDGLRCLAFVDGDKKTVRYMSRNGKEIPNIQGLFDDELYKLLVMGMPNPIVLDGEIVGPSFSGTMGALGHYGDKERSLLSFVVFDYIPQDDWNKSFGAIPQGGRSRTIQARVISCTNSDRTVITPCGIVCHTRDTVEHYFKNIVDIGYEGVIIKSLNAKYQWKRSPDWRKMKPTNTYDGRIIDVIEGEGKFVGTLGSLLVKGTDELGRHFETKVGSGFSDLQRDLVWRNRGNYMGKVVEVKAQEMSLAKDADTYSLRFPVFVKFRDDK